MRERTPDDLLVPQGTTFYGTLDTLVVRLTLYRGMFAPELQDIQSNHQTVMYNKFTAGSYQVLRGVIPDSFKVGLLKSVH